MRTFARALLCGLFATSFALTACDDDGDDTTTDTRADSTADTGGGDTGGTDSTATDSTATETTEDTAVDTAVETAVDTEDDTAQDTAVDTAQDTGGGDTSGGGACNNASDLAVINNASTDPAAKAAECGGTSCIAKLFTSIDEFESCVQTCMLNASLPNYSFVVSEACSTCYTKSVRCTAEFCGLNDPNKSCVPAGFGGKGTDSADCAECRADNGCGTTFDTCSGLTSGE